MPAGGPGSTSSVKPAQRRPRAPATRRRRAPTRWPTRFRRAPRPGPARSGVRSVSAPPLFAQHGLGSGDRPLPLRRRGPGARGTGRSRRTRASSARSATGPRAGRACRPSGRSSPGPGSTTPPTPNAPKVGNLSSRTSNPTPSAISSRPATLIGNTWKARNASSRQTPPTMPGKARARIPELDGEPEQTQREEQIGDLRVRERAEEALPPRHLDRLAPGAGGVERLLRAAEAMDRAAIELGDELVKAAGDEIDERWRRLERLAFGERPTLGYRFLSERDVPLPGLRQRPGERRDVGRHLVAHGLVDGLGHSPKPDAPRRCASPAPWRPRLRQW